MKKSLLYGIIAFAISILSVACSNSSAEVDKFVESLNAPEFRAKELATGLFTDSEATIDGKAVVLTLKCVKSIDLSAIGPDQIAILKSTAVEECKGLLMLAPEFKAGMETLAREQMEFIMRWTDTSGREISLNIDPKEILGEMTTIS